MEGVMRKGGAVWWLVVVEMLMCTAVCKKPDLYKVGGKEGWTNNVNYTEWAIHEHFYVGDWLLFKFDKQHFNVLEVNKTNYEQCNDHEFITNITRGGRDVFELKQARSYYFLSSWGYCFQGMKLEIKVVDFVPAPEPSPAKSGSPANAGNLSILLIMLGISSIWVSLLKVC